MKLTREQIIENNYTVKLQKEDRPFRVVKFPQSVDTEKGEVEMWTVPLTPLDSLLTVKTTEQLFASTEEEEETDECLIKDSGKIIVLDSSGAIVAETP